MKLPVTFGKYELLSQIGVGGMAEIYLARAFGVAGFEKRLVIKRIRDSVAQDPRFIQLFINEAKISVGLNHPNIVQVYDLGRIGPIWYMAMELLRGRDLNKIVKRFRGEQKKLPLSTSVAIVAELCRGLGYAHSQMKQDGSSLGLVHRDVSPHNIVLTLAGEVKLVDFGVARLMNTTEGKATQTTTGRPGGGKYAYMSPEQAQGLEVDHRTDIYSTGIVLWELIVGHRLYQDPDPAEKLRRVIDAVVPHPNSEGVDIDDDLWRILQTALAKNPDERYDTVSLFEEDLRAWLFHNNVQDFRSDITHIVQRAFPELEVNQSHIPDLHRMAQDVDELDPNEATHTAHSGEISDSVTHPPHHPSTLELSNGERKTVVAMVVDIDGLTDLSLQLDPEVLFKRHFQVLRWLRRIVVRYGGVVQRSVDDQILILFGVPKTQKDDLARALECAMELKRAVSDLLPKGMHLHLAIGVHTGDMTVTSRKKKLRYVARGDTTRLARRLSTLADHGEILVSERVMETAEVHFSLETGPILRSRGEKPTTPSFLLTGRRHGLRVVGDGPWLRRGNELEVIRNKIMELSKSHGGLVWLTGEVGTGKSRLLKELRGISGKRKVPLYSGCCSPSSEYPALEPFRDVLTDILHIETETVDDDFNSALKFLGHLGLPTQQIDALRSLLLRESGDQNAQTALWLAIERLFTGLSIDYPVIVALEDTHYLSHRHLEAVLKLVRRLVESKPILFIMTRRGLVPETYRDIGNVVSLGPFDFSAQMRLIRHFIDADEIEPEITELLLRTCEGNPLYLEQMIKHLLHEKNILVENSIASLQKKRIRTKLPNSLAALIAARIDALDPASKGALQLASAIGHTFSAKLLGEAMGLDHIKPLMTQLSQHGLVVQNSNENLDQWSFASELVLESADRGILGIQRRKYHGVIADAIEALYTHDLAPWYHILARHCSQCERHVDAAVYAYKAGLRLKEQQALKRALATFAFGLQCLTKVSNTPENWDARTQGEASLHLEIGSMYGLMGEHPHASKHLTMALDISSDSGLPWIEAKAHMELARLYTAKSQHTLASAHVDQARSLGRIQNDPVIQLNALKAAAFLAQELGQTQNAHELWQEALTLAGEDLQSSALCYLGMANQSIRRMETESAQSLLQQALQLATEAGDKILMGRVLNNLGLLHVWNDDLAPALERFREALHVRKGIGYTMGVTINHHNIGDVHFRMGDWARAWVSFQRSYELAESMDWRRGLALNQVFLGYIEGHQDNYQVGMDKILQAVETATLLQDAEIKTNGHLLAGRLCLETDRVDEGKSYLKTARDCAEENELLAMLPHIENLLNSIAS